MVVDSIRGECGRYKALAEAALAQVRDDELYVRQPADSNSVAAMVDHIAGNLLSRFTDFLESDGEKPWRDREAEFFAPAASRADLLERWYRGWRVFLDAVEPLTDAELSRSVTIRGQTLSVGDALHRSLGHTAYHVGQIVFAAKAIRGPEWRYLSIPPGGSAAYNQNPKRERPAPFRFPTPP